MRSSNAQCRCTVSSIQVTVVYSPATREVREVVLQLAAGATVQQALQGSGLLELFGGTVETGPMVGVWGRKAGLQQTLQDQDRVEIYRPLTVDPKVARRQRFSAQGTRSAGLFIKKRAGAKAGY